MKTSTKAFFALVGALLVGMAIYGGYQYPIYHAPSGQVQSSAGTNYNSAKFAGTTISLATPGAGATSTSILNTDSVDRIVTTFKVGCEGVGTSQTAYTGAGLASLQVSIGTTTAANPSSFLSSAAIALNYVLGTSTPALIVASSTLATATSSLASIWPAGTYETFFFNATNTAACTIGLDYIGS